MIASDIYNSNLELFQGKRDTGKDLYQLLLNKLHKIGPVRENKKMISVSLENRKVFASTLIWNQSIKLILRTNHRITNPRILNIEPVAENVFDHTILIESKDHLDEELMNWLEDAYQIGV